MAVLVCDTATRILSVAVGQNGVPLASTAVDIPRGHSKLLQPTIESVLRAGGVAVGDLKAIGVGVGPGSYTGVRLAVSNAKAMAFALSLPMYTLSTLLAMAEAVVPYACDEATVVMPLLFARRNRAFGAIYRKHDWAWQVVVPVTVLPVVDWIEQLRDVCLGRVQIVPAYIVHDFPETEQSHLTALLDRLTCGGESAHERTPGLAVALLQDVAGGIGNALVRLAAAGYAQTHSGRMVHGIVPEYGLQVEAEVKLGSRGDSSDGRG